MKKIGVFAAALLVVVGVTVATVVTQADDSDDKALTGTELTIEDWKRCRDEVNEARARRGDPPIEDLPTLGSDGQWHFNAQAGGSFYSCGTFADPE
jgi:hypothetical protein